MAEQEPFIDQAKTDEIFHAARQITEQFGMLIDEGQAGVLRHNSLPRDLIPQSLLLQLPESEDPINKVQFDLVVQTFYPSTQHNQSRLRASVGLRTKPATRGWHLTYMGIDTPGFSTRLLRMATYLGVGLHDRAWMSAGRTRTATMHEGDVILDFLRDYAMWRHDNS